MMRYGLYSGSGYLPVGTDYDPNAPWNQSEPEMEKCSRCGGSGEIYTLFQDSTNSTKEVSKCEYDNALTDSDNLDDWIKGDIEECSVCDGSGEVMSE